MWTLVTFYHFQFIHVSAMDVDIMSLLAKDAHSEIIVTFSINFLNGVFSGCVLWDEFCHLENVFRPLFAARRKVL